MSKLQDLKGQRFDRLVVMSYSGRVKRNTMWNCICDCGVVKDICAGHLKTGATRSCGCLSREIKHRRAVTHGETGTPEHRAWCYMTARCSPLHPQRKDYFDRGIGICKRWENYENFIADMGLKPSKTHSIDRINNDLGYSPDNCRWATRTEQARNKRNSKMITIGGIMRCLPDWCEILGLNRGTVHSRLKLGWSDERALGTKAT